MTPTEFLNDAIDASLHLVEGVGGPKPSDDARRMLLCIALQESGPKLDARYQGSPASSPGPARGFWQFEQGGGVTGVLNHAASQRFARQVCDELTVVAQPAAVWRALEGYDMLASAFARLLLWTDPAPLPTTEGDGWDCYMRLWRPGKPHRDAWSVNWPTASQAVAADSLWDML